MSSEQTWVEIRRGALRANLRAFHRLVGPSTKVMAVVKSNAYGHGLEPVVQSLRGQADWFGVANLDEALAVRRLDRTTPILVLSYWTIDDWRKAVKTSVDLPITSIEQLRELNKRTRGRGGALRCQLKLDVGTSRVGLLPDSFTEVITILRGNPRLRITGVFSHFADAENPKQTFTNAQTLLFQRYVRQFESALGPIPLQHIACTAAAIMSPKTRLAMVRIGIGLYGLWSDPGLEAWAKKRRPNFRLKPVLAWRTRLVQVKTIPAGATVGYGRSIRVRKATRIGVLPVGYNEGFDRRFSNRGQVQLYGKRANVIGRVCMNLTMVNLTGCRAKAGDVVTLLGSGPQGRGLVDPGQAAASIGTISYELVTRIASSLPRRLVA